MNKGLSLIEIMSEEELGIKRLNFKNLRMAKKGDKIKETDIWANNLCDKYCVQDPNGKEDDKKLFRKCMISPDVKKKSKAEEKKLAYSLKEIEDWCPKTCEALQPNVG
jgi:hypothetical protein